MTDSNSWTASSHDPAKAMHAQSAIGAALKARQSRSRYLPRDLFGEPAWDMLLDLMRARHIEEAVSVTSLCIASAVPPSTALRHMAALERHGLLKRAGDITDGRRVIVTITDDGARRMTEWAAMAFGRAGNGG